MVCIDSYLGGIKFCQIDVVCQLPFRCPQKLGYGFEKLGPEDGREMVTLTDTGRDSGGGRARAWRGQRSQGSWLLCSVSHPISQAVG